MYDISDINVKKKSFCIGMLNAQNDNKMYCNIVKKKKKLTERNRMSLKDSRHPT